MTKSQQTRRPTAAEPVLPGVLPEEVGEGLHPLLQYIVSNIRSITLACVVILVLAGGYGIYEYLKVKNHAEAVGNLGAVLASKQGLERVAALKSFADTAPSSVRTSALFELATAALEAKDLETAAAALDKLEDGADTSLSVVVSLGRARIHAERKEYDKALAILEPLRDKGPKAYAVSVNRTLAQVAEAAGRLDVAVAAWRVVLETFSGQGQGQSQGRQFLEYKIKQLEARQASKG